MAVVVNRRTVMTLFSKPDDPVSHRVRVVMAEKNINFDVLDVVNESVSDELASLNPYNTIPTLVDRDLVLYQPSVLTEYIDERFPHPPLMPVDPVQRASFRLAMYRIEREWYGAFEEIAVARSDRAAAKARKGLRESIASSNDLFAAKPFFMSDEYSLVDAAVAPVLWRLPSMGIELPNTAPDVKKYAERIFAREGFQNSLSEIEREMQDYYY